jgi:IPTL-CTERM motif
MVGKACCVVRGATSCFVSILFGGFLRRLISVFFLMVGWFVAYGANAAATITFSQVGNDVQATLTGTLTLTGLTADDVVINPNARVRGGGVGANLILGPTQLTAASSYSVISGPQSIGCSTANIAASSGSAGPNGPFGFNMSDRRLIVPSTFVPGNNVSASATWNGATISSLGLIGGTYVYSWAGDSLTIIIPGPSGCQPAPPQPIPTLSEWAQIMMMLAMFATAGFYGWRMKQR